MKIILLVFVKFKYDLRLLSTWYW